MGKVMERKCGFTGLDPLGRGVVDGNASFAEQPGWGGGLLFWKTRSLAALPLGEVSLQLGVHGLGLGLQDTGIVSAVPSHLTGSLGDHTQGSPEAQSEPVQPRDLLLTSHLPARPQTPPEPPPRETGTLGDARNLKLLKDSSLFWKKEKSLGIHQMSDTPLRKDTGTYVSRITKVA